MQFYFKKLITTKRFSSKHLITYIKQQIRINIANYTSNKKKSIEHLAKNKILSNIYYT